MFLPHEQIVILQQAELQKLNHPEFEQHQVAVDIIRFDKIHPDISGNKFFKLRFFLMQALEEHRPVLTFGGPWSNHLLATAFACHSLHIPCIGCVRGEEPKQWSPTLLDARRLGMQLHFLSREAYRNRRLPPGISPEVLIIPEGGYSATGVQGAATMLEQIPAGKYTEICCAVGTGTMMAGLASGTPTPLRGFLSLRIDPASDTTIRPFVESQARGNRFALEYGYHFGGYARHTPELTDFMNQFYETTGIPTDLVYTGKMFFGLVQLIRRGAIQPGSRILAIHSGGLQGNRSLPPGTLVY